MLSILFLLFGCGGIGHAPTAFDACMDDYEVACKCKNPSGGSPDWACNVSEEEKEQGCEESKPGGIESSDDWRDWKNCANRVWSDCDNSDWDCGDAP